MQQGDTTAITIEVQRRTYNMFRTLHPLQPPTLGWAAGGLLAFIGALMLVAPHQFASSAYAPLQPQLAWWSVMFLLVGAALLVVSALQPRLWVWRTVWCAAATALVLLASCLWRVGGWTGVVVYGVMGLSMLATTPRLSRVRQPHSVGPDLFVLIMGLSSVCNGLVILLLPQQFTGYFYERIRWHLPLNGLAFLVGGLAVLAVQLLFVRSRRVVWVAHVLAACGLWAWLVVNPIPLRLWTGIAYYGGLGLALAIAPWLGPRLAQIDGAALRIRLALTLAATAAIPLIGALTLITSQQEQLARQQAITGQQSVAAMLAGNIGSYVHLHEAAVATLASNLGAGDMSAVQQKAVLQNTARSYPEFTVLQLIDAQGNALLRTDEKPLSPSSNGHALFETIRRAGQPVVNVQIGRVLKQPMFFIGAPLQNQNGQFGGAVVGALDTSTVARLMSDAHTNSAARLMLVDQDGRVLAQPGAPADSILSDQSAAAAVAAMRASPVISGGLSYTTPDGEWVAGYARLPDLAWGIVVEQPAASALASVRLGREAAFVVLLLMLGAAAVVGILLARQLARPLAELAGAADQFATEATLLPVTRSTVQEITQLSDAFQTMRERLVARTRERERLLEREQAANAQAQAALQARDTFLSVASHELRTPLTSLLGNAQLLQRRVTREASLADRDQRSVDVIVAQAQRLNMMLIALLDISRIERGQLQVERLPLDLGALIRSVIDEVRPTLDHHQLVFHEPPSPLLIMGDALRLDQVVQNLLSNAVKYSSGGTITARVDQHDNWARLTVQDQGIGIPAAAIPHLFERFYRVESSGNRPVSGMGIGLYVVKEILAQHDGTITIASSEGQGSTFTVLLPLSRGQESGFANKSAL